MNNEIRELSFDEIEAVCGAGVVSILHDIVNQSIAEATGHCIQPTPTTVVCPAMPLG